MTETPSCFCCWDSDVNLYSCTEGHSCCQECLNRGIEILINENRNTGCINEKCSGHYPENVIVNGIKDKKLIQQYNILLFINSLQKLNLQNLHKCPFCDNRVILEDFQNNNENNQNNNTFFCMTGCKKYSCMNCNKEAHDGECVINNEHAQNEKLTNDFLLKCCGMPFYRGDACNKVKCPKCPKYYCWICKQQVFDYSHFSPGKICKLYGERPSDKTIEEIQHERLRPIPRLRPIINERRCRGTTKTGRNCIRIVRGNTEYCHSHIHQQNNEVVEEVVEENEVVEEVVEEVIELFEVIEIN